LSRPRARENESSRAVQRRNIDVRTTENPMLSRKSRRIGTVDVLEARDSELRQYKTALDAHAIVSATDAHGMIVHANDQFCAISGYAREELVGQNHRIVNSGRHPRALFDDMWRTIASGRVWKGEVCNRRKDGRLYWVLATIVPRVDVDGNVQGYLSFRVDITPLKQLQHEMAESRERAEVTLAAIGDGVLVTDRHGHVTYLNPVAERLTGWMLAEADGVNVAEVMPLRNEDSGEAVESPVEHCRRQGAVVGLAGQTVLASRDGRRTAIEDSAAPMFDREGRLSGVVMVFHDVTEKRALTRDLSWQVSHDALTGLASRVEFERELERLVRAAHESAQAHSLLYLDLDQFKIVNDTCGHAAGDELLKQLGLHMREQVRASDMLARLGGDEFGVLLENCALPRAMEVAAKLCDAVRDYRFGWAGKLFQVGASIGAVALDADCASASDALAAADVACYAAKDAGRNRVHAYRDADRASAARHEELHMAARLRSALQEDRFALFAQRIHPIGDTAANDEHHEILIRLRDESGALVPPGAFIPAAERYGLMAEIDRWVIGHALRMVAANRAHARVRLAINLSGLSLQDRGLPIFIREQLHMSRFDPTRLCFEITETAAIAHLATGVEFMKEVRSLGCSFALDDFGSGMSSFTYLKNLPVEYLKIDGAFVKDMTEDALDRTFVETIHRIGHAMGMKTIAEFVENDAILAALRDIGVDYAQGYGIARPVPFEEVCGEG
jgi:diguanylate cyclase (GGDEF)-like protein/PAS domain S-box-containing protein